MKYEKVIKGQFIFRPNRFIAEVMVDGKVENAHVKNTGRCKELLIEGAEVYLEDFQGRMGKRKLRFSLIGVKKGDLLINMDSQAPNKVVKEALESGSIKLPGMSELTLIRPEKTFRESRFDFYLEDNMGKRAFLEVKGVTLENDGIARFPDAPTLRGLKHVNELVVARSEGYLAYVVFIIQMKSIKWFTPNDETHFDFGEGLRFSVTKGVRPLAFDCKVTADTLEIDEEVEIRL